NLKRLGTTPEKLYTQIEPVLYHGTKTEDAFRRILLQGVLPSTSGNAGRGLYTVAAESIPYAERWGGDRNRVITFKIRDGAKFIDVTTGEGKRVFEQSGLGYDEFAEAF